jgi:hypothetical protein
MNPSGFLRCAAARSGAKSSAGGCGKSPASVDAGGPLSPLLQGSSWRVAAAYACSRRKLPADGLLRIPRCIGLRSPPAGNPCPRVLGKSRSRVARSTLVPCTHNRPTTNPLLPRFPRRSRCLDQIGQLPSTPTAPGSDRDAIYRKQASCRVRPGSVRRRQPPKIPELSSDGEHPPAGRRAPAAEGISPLNTFTAGICLGEILCAKPGHLVERGS